MSPEPSLFVLWTPGLFYAKKAGRFPFGCGRRGLHHPLQAPWARCQKEWQTALPGKVWQRGLRGQTRWRSLC